jgi:hypothetical protein
MRGFQLMQNVLPGQHDALSLFLAGGLLGRERRLKFIRTEQSLRLLILDRLTLPTSCQSAPFACRNTVLPVLPV